MVRTCLIVISEGDTPMICEVSTPKITGFKSLNKNHPGNLKISQVFEIIQKILNWLIFSLLGPGAYGKSLSGEGGQWWRLRLEYKFAHLNFSGPFSCIYSALCFKI